MSTPQRVAHAKPHACMSVKAWTNENESWVRVATLACVWPPTLIDFELVQIGIQLKWFESYLNNRVQQCMINGKLSSPKTITCGGPQGSILGPLLFLLYINDMPESLNYSTPSLYADDTEIFASSNDCGGLVHKVNNDLENIRKWW